jgi:hypothetical protein
MRWPLSDRATSHYDRGGRVLLSTGPQSRPIRRPDRFPEVHVTNQPLVPLILKGFALAMGVAAVVLSILGTAPPATLITLLGLGLFSLAVWALQKA